LNKSENIVWHPTAIQRNDHESLLNQKASCLWFTGLSGSGKSTIAQALAETLHKNKHHVYTLDGDNIRHGLCKDLGFSDDDRNENIRRIAEVAKLFVDSGTIVLCSFISPFIADRENARRLIGDDFIEIFIDCPYEICAQRDPKGLYQKAAAGEIKNFTGLDSPYEAPENPELTIKSHEKPLESAVEEILKYLNISI
jgi:adenylylsulfate kinase